MKAFWQHIHDELEVGRKVFAAFVVANKKGSPGTPAARMLVREDGSQFGTIGGGVMEMDVIGKAKTDLAKPEFSTELIVLTHRKDNIDTINSGLICGGSQTNLYHVFTPADHLDLIKNILEAIAADQPACLEFSSAHLQIVKCNSLQPFTTKLTQSKGGEWSVQLNLIHLRRIAVFGGGHCGVALANAMHRLDYAVDLFELRNGVPTLAGLHPKVRTHDSYANLSSSSFKHIEAAHAVVLTHSYPTDVAALKICLMAKFASIGVMGSRAKLKQIFEELRNHGFDQQSIDRINAPVGLDCDSDTPEEIAVSIAAQFLLNRNNYSLS